MASFEEILSGLEKSESNPHSFAIEADGIKKPIQLHLFTETTISPESALHLVVLTHGAGGTALSAACLHLAQGLASSCTSSFPIAVLAFDGSMNLKARVKAFLAVIEYASSSPRVQTISLGGRSMGCRAAAMAFAQSPGNTKLSGKLVLESYPLIGKGEDARKQVLMDLPETAEVLFVIGSKDEMCTMEALDIVRGTDMKAKSSIVLVKEVDHGMGIAAGVAVQGGSKKEVAEHLGKAVGKIAGDWLAASERRKGMQMDVSWTDDEVHQTEWREASIPDIKKREHSPPEATEAKQPNKRRKRA